MHAELEAEQPARDERVVHAPMQRGLMERVGKARFARLTVIEHGVRRAHEFEVVQRHHRRHAAPPKGAKDRW